MSEYVLESSFRRVSKLRRHGIMKVSIETDIATGTFVMAPGHRGRTGQLSSVETGAMWIY